MLSQTIRVIIFFLCLSLTPSLKYARSFKFTGTDIYGQHIRALSMGNAFTAVAKTGETALMYNPAGLATTFKDPWNVAFALNTEVGVSESALTFAGDADALTGDSDPGQISTLLSKYEDAVIFLGAKASLYGFYQEEEPIDNLNRVGTAYQRLIDGGIDVRFTKLADITLISFTDDSGQIRSSTEIASDVEAVLENELGITLTSEQLAELETVIEAEISGANAEDLEELATRAEQLNAVLSNEIQIKVLTWDIRSAGVAVSILDEKLKMGVSFNYFSLISRRANLQLATATGGGTGDLDTLASEQKGEATGFDLGWLYTFDLNWHPQIGLTWQNVGRTDLGSDTDVEIVETFNLGISVAKEMGVGLIVLAADLTDLLGNYESATRRSYLQRSHIGGELGIGEAASMENRYLYLRVGYNRGQPTYGVEASLPYNIIRIGYAKIGTDVGDDSKSIPIIKQTIYLSFGGVI